LRDLLGNIIDSMPSVLSGVDENGRITLWNREAENATGIIAENARGQLLVKIFPRLAPEIKAALETREIQKYLRIESPVSGKPYFSDVLVYPLISDGSEGAVIRVDDVTERVRMEEVMIQTEKMMSVGGLAAGMAHEINNPLSIILHGVHNIIRRISPDLPKNIQTAQGCRITLGAVRSYMEQRDILKFLEGIEESGNRAADIVANMLQFSRRSESGMTSANLAELLDKTVGLAENDYDLKKKYDFRQIQIIREYNPSVPEVPCEAVRIQQVFLNILKNGAQAMAETSSQAPERKPPCFILRIIPETDTARIEIEDNGPGMSESVCRRIFEPFYTTKEVGVGTGLGLFVSYFIITENHNGTMSVESAPGRGAKFIIRLPINRGMMRDAWRVMRDA
jgi:PAS domain S-box-containing protein